MVATNYKNAFKEVYVILDSLVEEDYKKIPPELIETIYRNMNQDYKYELDEEQELSTQKMLPETKAILFNIFRDYLSTEEQKKKIIRMQKEERQKNELKKREQYNTDVFANKEQTNNPEIQKEQVSLIKYKESILKKIINLFKNYTNLYIIYMFLRFL